MVEYIATLRPGIDSKEVDSIIWQTIRKVTISVRQASARLVCSVPAGPAKYIVPGVQKRLQLHAGTLRFGNVITDETAKTEFEVILNMDPPDWTFAQQKTFESLNVSPDVQNATRFESNGEQMSVRRTDGQPFTHAQITRLIQAGITLQETQPPAIDEKTVENPVLPAAEKPAAEEPLPQKIKFREFL